MPEQQEPQPAVRPPTIQDRARKIFAPVLAVGAAVLKFGGVLLKLKFFTLFFSMLASIGAYALAFGWQFAVGFVLLIFVHEMGHVIVLRARGIKAGLPVFLPFLGAFVSMKSTPRTVYDEALSGIAGPVFGAVGAFAVLGLAGYEDSDFLRALAYTGFLLNLFNLLPFLPLDGGRTAAAVSPKLWIVGLVGLLAYEIYRPSPIVPLLLVLGGLETYRRWRGRDTDASKAYYALTAQQRINIGTAYLGLIAVLVWAMHSYPVPNR
ncbi:MAG: peptidase [Frankiales bacterium]|nr:peptidase [Frankiales bacterium]